MPISPREAVLKALIRVRKNGAWSDAALNSILLKEHLDERDAALTARIFYGVVQNLALCDFYISHYSSIKMAKMEPQVLDILRLSVYQLIFMSKIPVSAAVSEGVELTKKFANPRAAGLVNAILRKIASSIDHLPAVRGDTPAERLSILYSHPLWLVEDFIKQLGEQGTEELLQANNREADITVKVNTLKADTQAVIASLADDQVEAAPHLWLPDCLVLRNARHIEKLTAFKKGLFYVQDPAAVLAVLAAEPQPGMFVIDACAAPGGKSFAAALEIKDSGRILSCDINEKKLQRICEGAQRLGLRSIEPRVMDATETDNTIVEKADIVLADVPCSGFGVIRKKPEIRYKADRDVSRLPELQHLIIDNLSKYVRPGGILLYSTCTLNRRENEEVINAFLTKHSDYSPESFSLPGPAGQITEGMTTLWPHIHGTDGFFICRLRKRA